jgi:ACT domain-containing protein
MKKHKHIIVGVHITDRVKHAGSVQKVLTDYGVHIKTRLGLHDVDGEASSSSGIILLELVGDEAKCSSIIKKLTAIRGVEAKKIVFSHD